jgi:hypothetical protein
VVPLAGDPEQRGNMADRGAKADKRSCLKSGCLGCAGATALFVIIAGGIALTALIMGPPPQEFVDPGIVRTLPVSAVEPGSTDTGPGDQFPRGEFGPQSAQPGRVVLDLAGGEFEIRPGEPGSPVRVDGRYNAGAFEIEEDLQQEEDGSWTYRLRFSRHVSWMRMLYGDQHEGNRVRVTLPRGMPFSLEGNVRTGVSRWELGGLWLLGADLRIETGEHRLRFSEPTFEPMGRFGLEARMGEFRVDRLGNASPSEIKVRGGMGEMRLDLRGQWWNDADVAGRWRMGAFEVRVPRGVNVETEGATVFMGAADLSRLRRLPEVGGDAPTLRLDLSGSMGELVVRP